MAPVYSKEDMQIYSDDAFDEQKTEEDLKNRLVTFFLAEMMLPEQRATMVLDFCRMLSVMPSAHRTVRTKIRPAVAPSRLKDVCSERIPPAESGKALMEACIRMAQEQILRLAWLGVYPLNFTAINFL